MPAVAAWRARRCRGAPSNGTSGMGAAGCLPWSSSLAAGYERYGLKRSTTMSAMASASRMPSTSMTRMPKRCAEVGGVLGHHAVAGEAVALCKGRVADLVADGGARGSSRSWRWRNASVAIMTSMRRGESVIGAISSGRNPQPSAMRGRPDTRPRRSSSTHSNRIGKPAKVSAAISSGVVSTHVSSGPGWMVVRRDGRGGRCDDPGGRGRRGSCSGRQSGRSAARGSGRRWTSRPIIRRRSTACCAACLTGPIPGGAHWRSGLALKECTSSLRVVPELCGLAKAGFADGSPQVMAALSSAAGVSAGHA
jgi:hypothetical protein